MTSDLGYVLTQAKAAAQGSTDPLPSAATFSLATQAIGGMLTTSTSLMNADPQAAVDWLNTNVFSDANYLGDGIYKVPPELACTTSTVGSDGTTTTTIDPDCVTQLAKAELRLRVEQDDALRIWIQLDPDHDEPIGLVLRSDELSLTIDLDDADHAMVAVALALGEQAPNAALSGQATIDLHVLGPAHAQLSLSIDRAISVAVADQDADLAGPTATRFASPASQVATVDLDGSIASLDVHVNLGETTLHLAGDDVTASTDVDLAGATLGATLRQGSLMVSNVSLGTTTTTIAKNGVPAITIDLNPGDGRTLGAVITTDATGSATVAVSPRFDLHESFDHAALGDLAPTYDVTNVNLTGSLRASSGAFEVLTGTFSIATDPAEYGVVVTDGQCVASTFASYALVPCP